MFGDLRNPSSLHAFGYANGNPLLFIDPYGEAGFFEWLTRVAFCPPAPPGSQVRKECEEAADAVNRDPVGKLAVRAPFAPAVAVGVAANPPAAVLGAAVGLTGEVAVKTYEDPKHRKTLDQFTLDDWSDVADAGAVGGAAGPVLSGVSQAGPVGNAAVKTLQVGAGALGVVEGGKQVIAGVQQGDSGRVAYGVGVGFMGATAVSDVLPARLNPANYEVALTQFQPGVVYSNPLPITLTYRPPMSSLLDAIVEQANRVAVPGAGIGEAQATALRQNLPVVQRRSAAQTAVARAEFNKDQARLIAEWEAQTGIAWPEGATPHHVIPLESGGANKWYNLMPTRGALPNHSLPDAAGPHAKGSVLRQSVQQSRKRLPPGTETDLRRKGP